MTGRFCHVSFFGHLRIFEWGEAMMTDSWIKPTWIVRYSEVGATIADPWGDYTILPLNWSIT